MARESLFTLSMLTIIIFSLVGCSGGTQKKGKKGSTKLLSVFEAASAHPENIVYCSEWIDQVEDEADLIDCLKFENN